MIAINAQTHASRESRVWFVTGATSGFGAAITRAASAAGHTVFATGRRVRALEQLAAEAPGESVHPLQLDVTRQDQISQAVSTAISRTGRIDVLVNNAGNGHVGAVEETSEEELRDMLDVLFFGPMALTRAVLPHMRRARTGTIVQISSVNGQVGYQGFSSYVAAKFALEGASECLAAEVAPFGIDVRVVEPGLFRTDFTGSSLRHSDRIDDYAEVMDPVRELVRGFHGTQPGDPDKAAARILEVVDDGPFRLPLGVDSLEAVLGKLTSTQREIEQWSRVSASTDLDDLL
ncbi:SDR family NAD(P)-dependent oxidoreductase [Saccharopolyspora erythraea]|uniref:oxidoreductase n=1 Tax=Saccharopolyspora erythraea TaxID=1836 RepID=UPI001BEE82F3|nr:oxidoreductase [Saccharopolyspora erythraea]QUH02161.1 SDR family NAD(P)-dependent oxidoreductase [Saccharopolyspora erythraea]